MSSRQQVPVFVRVRPLNTREKENGAKDAWELGEDRLTCSVSGKDTTSSFRVNKVFGTDSCTEQVFTKAAKEIIAHAIQGWSGTVFAYGQTSSGKTHTMMGSGAELGIVQMSMDYMWAEIEKDTEADYIVRCTSMEVYNERLTDLKTGNELEIKEGRNGDPTLKGETPVVVSSSENAIHEITTAMHNRHLGKTNMNDQSSRSHTIFRIQIDRIPKGSKASTRSLLHLVDLAGSESIKKTGTQGAAAREGSNINQSLSALVRVIKCLTESKNPGYVPFRDSKLTRLLKTSLGGNTKTAIICCVTSASDQYDQTVSTLRFAQEASKVKNDPKRCVLAADQIPPNLRRTIQAMAAAQTAEAKEEHRKELDKVITEMEAMREASAVHAKMLEDEREKRRAAEAALFNQKEGKGRVARRQTMCGAGLSSLNWSPTKSKKVSFGDDQEMSSPGAVATGRQSTVPAARLSAGAARPSTVGRLSVPAVQGRMSAGLRKDLEEMRKELREKESKLLEREHEIEENRCLMQEKEMALKATEAMKAELQEKLAAMDGGMDEEKQALKDEIVQVCEMAQETCAAKDKAREEMEERLHDEKQLKLDMEMEKHRLAHELSVMQQDMRALKASNMALTNAEKDRTLLQQKAAALSMKNEEMLRAQHILDTANARGWQSAFNQEVQDAEAEQKKSLENELVGIKQAADKLQREIGEIKTRHASQIEQLKEEQVQREQDHSSRLEALKDTHRAELVGLEKNAKLEVQRLEEEKQMMQNGFEAQIDEERTQLTQIEKQMARALEELQESSEVESTLRQVKYEEETSALRAKLEMEIKQHEGKMNALREEMVQNASEASEEIEALKVQHAELMEAARTEAEQQAEALEKLTRDTKTQAMQEISRVKREAEAEKDSILKREEEKIDTLQQTLKDSKESYEADVERLEEEAAQTEAHLKEEADRRIKALEGTHRSKMEETTQLFSKQEEDYQSKFAHLQKVQANHEAQVEEEKLVMQERFERKESELVATLEEEKQRYDANRNSLQKTMESKIAVILQRAEEEHAELRRKANDSKKHITEVEERKKQEVEKLHESLAQQEMELKQKQVSMKDQMEQQITQLKAERDTSIHEVEHNLKKELSSILSEREMLESKLRHEQQEHQQNVNVLQKQLEAQLKEERNATQAVLQEVQLKAESEKAELTEAFSVLKEQHKQEVASLSQQFDAERQQLEQAKRQEVSRVKEEFHEKLAEVEQEKERQKEEFQTKAQELEEARLQEVGIARDEVEKERAKHESMVQELNEVIRKAQDEKQAAVEEIKSQCTDEQRKVEEEFKVQLDEKEADVLRLEAEKQEELLKAKAELNDMQEKSEQTQCELQEQLQTDLTKASLEYSAVTSTLEAEIGSLQGDVEKQQQAHEVIAQQHNGQLKMLETQFNEALAEEKRRSEEEQRGMLQENLVLTAENTQLSEMNKQQKEELDCSMMGPLREARREMEVKLAKVKGQNAEQRTEIEQLKKKLRLAEADKEQLKNKVQHGGRGMMGKPPMPKPAPKGKGEVDKLKAKLKEAETHARKLEEAVSAQKDVEFEKMMEDAKEVIMMREGEVAQLQAKVVALEQQAMTHTKQEVQKVVQMGRSSIAQVTAQAEAKIRELEQEKDSMKAGFERMIADLQNKVRTVPETPKAASAVKKLEQENEELKDRLQNYQDRVQKALVEKQAAITEKEALQDSFEQRLQNEKRILRKQFRQAIGHSNKESATREREVISGRERDMPVVP